MQPTLIFQTLFGSRLYGTQVPESDYDLKGVFLPTAQQILLGRVPRVWTSPDPTTDNEAHSLQRFLELLAQGQTMALDMLFAPGECIKQMDPIWTEMVRHSEKFISKQCAAAIGYAKSQAAKYSLRGSRITALQAVIEVLKAEQAHNKNWGIKEVQFVLMDHGYALTQLPPSSQKYIQIDTEPDADGIKFLTVCEKKVGLNCRVALALQTYEHMLKGYGERAHQAQMGGADWKALYHAVRVTEQTIELLETGHITFPRPNAADLVKIRLGGYQPEEVFDRIEAGIVEIDAAQKASSLQEKPDTEFIDQFVSQVHGEIVLNGGA